MSSYSVLLDNSAIRLFALADPSAERTNDWIRRFGLIPVLSPFTMGEILKGLVIWPMSSELCERCRYLISLENLFIYRDVPNSIQNEYLDEGTVYHDPYDDVIRREILSLLRESSIGATSPRLKLLSDAYYSNEETEAEKFISVIKDNTDFEEFKKRPLECFATQELVYQTARKVLLLHFMSQGVIPLPEAVERVCLLAAQSPERVPYLAGAVRIQIWANWYVANNGRIPNNFRSDMTF